MSFPGFLNGLDFQKPIQKQNWLGLLVRRHTPTRAGTHAIQGWFQQNRVFSLTMGEHEYPQIVSEFETSRMRKLNELKKLGKTFCDKVSLFLFIDAH